MLNLVHENPTTGPVVCRLISHAGTTTPTLLHSGNFNVQSSVETLRSRSKQVAEEETVATSPIADNALAPGPTGRDRR